MRDSYFKINKLGFNLLKTNKLQKNLKRLKSTYYKSTQIFFHYDEV